MTLPDRYAVIGHPVAHSQSPWIHAEFARQIGQIIDYGRIDCPAGAFEVTVGSSRAAATLLQASARRTVATSLYRSRQRRLRLRAR